MEIDWNKVFTFSFSISAIVISIITIIMTRKNTKKQIRVGKLEEILEIISFLSSCYQILFILINDMEIIVEKNEKGEKLEGDYLNHKNRVEDFFNIIGKDNLSHKISRLGVLANSYLPNKSSKNVKLKILVLNNLYNIIFMIIAQNDLHMKNVNYKDGIPRPKRMRLFIKDIEKEIIKEMHLGYDSISDESFMDYRNNQFKIDTGIIEIEKHL